MAGNNGILYACISGTQCGNTFCTMSMLHTVSIVNEFAIVNMTARLEVNQFLVVYIRR